MAQEPLLPVLWSVWMALQPEVLERFPVWLVFQRADLVQASPPGSLCLAWLSQLSAFDLQLEVGL